MADQMRRVVEDEDHVLMTCELCRDERATCCEKTSNISSGFNPLNECDTLHSR